MVEKSNENSKIGRKVKIYKFKKLHELSSTRNLRKTTPKHIMTKLLKSSDKEKILKALCVGGERDSMYRGTIKRTHHFLSEATASEKTVKQQLSSPGIKNRQPRILLLVKISQKQRQNFFSDLQKLKQLITRRPALE